MKSSSYDSRESSSTFLGINWRLLWLYTGPGWLMSLAYIDPGNLESDLQSGAYTGYQLLWVVFLSTACGFLLQTLALRLGNVTKRNLAEVCSEEYSKKASFVLWIMAEIAIIGSDIQEVLGSAIALRLLFNTPLWLGCIITGLDTFTFLALHSAGMRYLEAFFGMILTTMLCCVIVNFVSSKPDVHDVLHGLFVPEITSAKATIQAVGTIGAIIMPHNLFLHSALVAARSNDKTSTDGSSLTTGATSSINKIRQANFYFTIESAIALVISFIINGAVVSSFGATFYSLDCSGMPGSTETACVPFDASGSNARSIYDYRTGIECSSLASCPPCNSLSDIQGGQAMSYCQPIGLTDAGEALTSVLGSYASTLWAIGLLASGQASTMTGTFAGQYVMAGFLKFKVQAWQRVFVTRCIALVPAVLVAIVAKSGNESSTDKFDEFLNALQSIQLPFAMIPLLVFTSNKRIMGEEFANSRIMTFLVSLLGMILLIVNFYFVFQLISGASTSSSTMSFIEWCCIAIVCAVYFWFILVILSPIQEIFKLQPNVKGDNDTQEELHENLLREYNE